MNDLGEVLEARRKLVDKKATEARNTRDDWNAQSKIHFTTRNEYNTEVRELVKNAREQKEIRERMNDEVRERKRVRSEANSVVKETKETLRVLREGSEFGDSSRPVDKRGRPITVQSLSRESDRLEREFSEGRHTGKNEKKVMLRLQEIRRHIKEMQNTESSSDEYSLAQEEMREAVATQEAAHIEVEGAAEQAQAAHQLMIDWQGEVEARREFAEAAHRKLRLSKKEADIAHKTYILSLRCLHSVQDISRARRDLERGAAPRLSARQGVQDLMSKLMSGETLTTEELLALQREQ
jgi:uncharacterized coiled-coil DUF342 family protein